MSARTPDGGEYAFDIQLFGGLDVDKSTWVSTGREVQVMGPAPPPHIPVVSK